MPPNGREGEDLWSSPPIAHQSPISLGRFNEFGVSLSLLALLADFDRKEPEKVFQARGDL
jgi:hypothetical protein